MTQHDHTELTDGCFRCDLNRDEAAASEALTVDDVTGLLGPDWTGGLSSVDFVRAQRQRARPDSGACGMTADQREQRTAYGLRDQFREVADLLETVAAIEPTAEPGGGVRSVPGSRLPPGMREILDADEVTTAIDALSEWAEFCVHILLDEADVPAIPDATPARLRLAGEHAAHFLHHDDELLALTIQDDLHEHLKIMRRLARRGTRVVQTGMRCQVVTCSGRLVSPLGRPGSDRHDADLHCDKCGAVVPHIVWSAWPKARVTYVTVEHAAKIAGTTVDAVKRRASRGKWRRVGTGRDVRYHVDDVRGDTPELASA
jgi:hypothetical protein